MSNYHNTTEGFPDINSIKTVCADLLKGKKLMMSDKDQFPVFIVATLVLILNGKTCK